MKFGRTLAVALAGVSGTVVNVEAHIGSGLPTLTISGMADKACGQAPDRIRSAVMAAGASLPTQRTVVNLSPASITKHGSLFDVAIAVAVLTAASEIGARLAATTVHLGELGLDGSIRGVPGVLPAVLGAAKAGVTHVVVPRENVGEAQLVDGVSVHTAATLGELLELYRRQQRSGEPLPVAAVDEDSGASGVGRGDLADVVGQTEARLALELAATGAHHMLLTGPPGVGKTMLAERLVTLLPTLSRAEALQTHAIRSLAGLAGGGLDLTPPLEAPHHTASTIGIVGGGSGVITPGAISRAHGGVLFLDEAPEFRTSVLQCLRQPLESGQVTLSRARESVTFPAAFLLVMAANPCPCGRAWGRGSDCACSALELRRYQGKLRGPLMDRIDIRITVPPVAGGAFGEPAGESSAVVAARVLAARGAQLERWRGVGVSVNGRVPGHILRRAPFRLPRQVTRTIDDALDRGVVSLRGYDRLLRLTWSQADCAGRVVPNKDDVDAAWGMRSGQVAA